jgi:phage baseplate assembly protein W
MEHELLGVDILLNNGDFQVNQAGDLSWTAGLDNLEQALVHRIRTVIGALIWHPEYGTIIQNLISKPNTDVLRTIIAIELLRTLSEEPRIERINNLEVKELYTDTIVISLEIIPISSDKPENLLLRIKL